MIGLGSRHPRVRRAPASCGGAVRADGLDSGHAAPGRGFADLTHDHQWIHVDEERAKEGPFGTTIAHGYLTLSLVPFFLGQLLEVSGTSMAVNYGLEKVRFPAPVPVGSRVRSTAEIVDVQARTGTTQVTVRVSVECDAAEKPVCVADVVILFVA